MDHHCRLARQHGTPLDWKQHRNNQPNERHEGGAPWSRARARGTAVIKTKKATINQNGVAWNAIKSTATTSQTTEATISQTEELNGSRTSWHHGQRQRQQQRQRSMVAIKFGWKSWNLCRAFAFKINVV
jgi:hypothetical protein